MRKYLPTSTHSINTQGRTEWNRSTTKLSVNTRRSALSERSESKGFTLIEILIVVAIIAILAIIAFAAFSGLIARGNDTRRHADVKGIADALEVKRGNAATYQPITATDFGTGKFPKEPTATRAQKYCYTESGVAPISNPAPWDSTACPPIGTWTNLDGATGITPSATARFFKICTVNEAATGGATLPDAAVICYGSRQ